MLKEPDGPVYIWEDLTEDLDNNVWGRYTLVNKDGSKQIVATITKVDKEYYAKVVTMLPFVFSSNSKAIQFIEAYFRPSPKERLK